MIKRRTFLLVMIVPYLISIRWMFLMAERESSLLYFNLAVVSLISVIGTALNLLAIYANKGRMPTRGRNDETQVLITEKTRFTFLSNIFYIRPFYFSIGDFLLYIGLLMNGPVWFFNR